LFLFGEPAGTRTQDHLIKSQVLYHLSYRLAVAGVEARAEPVNSKRGAVRVSCLHLVPNTSASALVRLRPGCPLAARRFRFALRRDFAP
jgi:hypothetical protein